jgi:uncharacterized membrane protein
MEEAKENKKELKAKKVSLFGKIIAGIILLVGFVLKCLNIFNCEVDELIKIAFAILAICAPIDINISLDKFLKGGNQNENDA